MRPRSSVAVVVRTVHVHSQASSVSGSATALLRQISYSPAIASTPPSAGRMKYGCLTGLPLIFCSERVPLVVTVGGQDAAADGEGLLEGGLLRDGLHPGVDQPAADRGVLGPGRDQPPLHRGELADHLVGLLAVLALDHGDHLVGRARRCSCPAAPARTPSRCPASISNSTTRSAGSRLDAYLPHIPDHPSHRHRQNAVRPARTATTDRLPRDRRSAAGSMRPGTPL